MAAGPSSLENHLSCQICFENFEEDGDHVPRILPCHHTVCEKCVKGMIRGNKIICPECREEHEVKNQEKSFQQNKYILVQMSRKKKEKEEVHKTELCPEHKKEIILFCEEEHCKKPICKTCLTREHKKHDVIEIEEKKKAELLKNIDNTKMNLTEKIAILSQAKDQVSEKTKVTVNDLKKAKQEVNKKFDSMIKEAEKKMRDADTRIDNNIAMIKENIVLLDQMRVNISTEKEFTTEGLIDGEETVAEVRNIVKVNISGNKTFNIKTFQANPERFEEEAITVVFPENTTVKDLPAPGKPIPIITDVSKLKWKVTATVNPMLYGAILLATLTDGSVAVTGQQGPHWMLKRFNMNNKTEVYSGKLNRQPHGLSEIMLGGTPSLAISYINEDEIEFRDLSNLNQIIHSFSTGSLQPGLLCAASPSTLLVADWPISMFSVLKVHRLYCRENVPELVKETFSANLSGTQDMCYVPAERKPLLIAACASHHRAYYAINGREEWRIRLPYNLSCYASVTTDGCNYVLACDDEGIKALSIATGQILGCLVKSADKEFGKPILVRWCSSTSGLVVGHHLNHDIHISTIHFE